MKVRFVKFISKTVKIFYFNRDLCQKVLTFSFLSTMSFAQGDISFEKFSTQQGLSQNSIVRILQDSRGFLWICTFDGLNRYDGYEFKILRNISDDSTSLSNNKILSICEDKDSAIWVGTYGGGLNRYDRKKENFKRYLHDSNKPNSISGNNVTSIMQDKSGYIWIGTFASGLNRFDPGKQTFLHYKHDNSNDRSIGSNNIISVFEDKAGIIWVGTLNGLEKFDKEKEVFEHYKFDPGNPGSISSNRISSILQDNAGKIWIGTFEGGLNMIYSSPGSSLNNKNPSEIKFYHFKHNPSVSKTISSNGILSILQDSWGDIWVGTDGGGLNKIHFKKNLLSGNNNFREEAVEFLRFKHNPDDASSLSDDRVWSILEDKSGILWVGTNAGLNKIDDQKKQFLSYSYDPMNPGSISDGDVSSIFEDRSGHLWIGTGSGGLNLYDAENNRFIKYKHQPDNPNSLSNDEIFAITGDREGNLWIGTYEGLNKLSREYVSNNKSPPVFLRYKNDPADQNSLSDNRVYSILEDKSGNLWIGTVDGGLNRLLPNTAGGDKNSSPVFQHFKHEPGNPSSLSADRVFSIFEDKQGDIWIGTWGGGLNKIKFSDKLDKTGDKFSNVEFIHYKNDPDNPNSLSDNGVSAIFEDKTGVLWIGTYGGGLNRFNIRDETFRHYTEAEGLSNNVVLGILDDAEENLWLSTVKGLNKFNPASETFVHFDESDGLPGNEFSLGAYKTRKGEIFFGSTKGLVRFFPDSIIYHPFTSPVIITDFKLFNHSVPIGFDSLNGRSLLSESISETERIDLNYNDDVISFEFTAIDFRGPEKINYLYKMEGFDKEWNHTDASRRFANYTNLDPGSYIFKVKRDENGTGQDVLPATIRIVIQPPWWRTVWAYLLYILISIGSVALLYLLQMRRMRLRHEVEMSRFETRKLHEIDEIKSRFFANISHEFRTPLTLIMGPVKELIGTEQDSGKAEMLKTVNRNADMLYGLVNQLMDLSKLEAGKMVLKACETDLVPSLKGIIQSFMSLAERKNIELRFQSERAEIISYFDIDKVEKIVINILSNAFKFTGEGKKIEVKAAVIDNNVQLVISDEGIGIPADRLENIFDRFYQVDATHTREHEGTGIGLALTKELVELHKGSITVESREGEGSSFIVTLPLGKNHLKPEEICEETAERETIHTSVTNTDSHGKITTFDISLHTEIEKPLLLIVEDNVDVRNYTRGHLSNDYRIIEAVDGEEGLKEAFEHIPDLIISDVMMPKLDGLMLCDHLKNDERTSHIPIILLTAKATGQDKINGLETGADDYIMKPFDARELQIRVKNLIDQRKKLAERYRKRQFFDISDIEASSADKKFLNKAFEIIKKHMSDGKFTVDIFAGEMALSRVQLHRKFVALTGHPPGDIVRIVRLTKASELIQGNFGNISEIALEVGFSNPANFAKAFRVQFGVSPTEFKNK